jgi:hypothetical protein
MVKLRNKMKDPCYKVLDLKMLQFAACRALDINLLSIWGGMLEVM